MNAHFQGPYPNLRRPYLDELRRIFAPMLLSDFLRALEQIVPLEAAGYSRDAIGLQVGFDAKTPLTKVLFAYEVTQDVVKEAKQIGAKLIVAFHPLIFPTIPAVTDGTRTGTLLRDLIKHDIALYIQHTAFDTHPEFGTSRLMAEKLGLANIGILREVLNLGRWKSDKPFGMGAIGNLAKPLTRNDLLKLAAKVFKSPVLRHNAGGAAKIERVAVLGGAGMDYYDDAASAGAQAFITADVRYHDFYRADHDNLLLIDAGHAETERFVTRDMKRAAELALKLAVRGEGDAAPNVLNLQRHARTAGAELPSVTLVQARSEPNGVRYFTS